MAKSSGQKAGIFGAEKYPVMHKASKWDHGEGPKGFTHMGKKVAGTGPSQHPKQSKIARSGKKTGA